MAVETLAPEIEERIRLPWAVIQPPWVAGPYRLWSLLDIMKTVDPRFLREVISFCRLDGVFDGVQDACKKLGFTDVKPSDGKVFLTLPEAQEIADLFIAHGLPRSADILLEWTRKDVRSRKLPPEVVMSELQRSIERELRASIFLHIEEDRRGYFEGRTYSVKR